MARAVDYASAGTVEFIVDRQRNFYFLEMNTRLQVEHPVTEAVTGLDLVELMIRIAAGERLRSSRRTSGRPGGQSRRGFMPKTRCGIFCRRSVAWCATGPPKDDGIRIDTGVFEGAEISMYYDPMIAKLIAAGSDREQAIERLQGALDAFHIAGVRHNIPFLAAITASDRFRRGALSTDFIAEEFPDGFRRAARIDRRRRA